MSVIPPDSEPKYLNSCQRTELRHLLPVNSVLPAPKLLAVNGSSTLVQQAVPQPRQSLSINHSMSTKKSSRMRGGTNPPPPALPRDISLSQIQRLPLATIRLYLNQYHLVETGNKATAAKRLHNHLQTQASPENSSNSSPSDEEDDANNSDSSREDGSSGEATVPPAAPFTSAQQKALTEAIKSAMDARKRRKRPRHRTPTISPPSSSGLEPSTSERKSRAPTRSKRARHSRYSSSSSTASSSSTSPSYTSSSSSSSDRHHHSRTTRRRRRHRRHHARSAGQRQRHTAPVPRKLRNAIQRGEFVDLNKLLCEHLTLVGSARASRTSRSHSTRYITGLDTWLEAWSIYAGVLSSFKPKLGSQLFQYQAFIARSSRRFQPYAWLQYDSQFRLKIASNPNMSWSTADSELVATWLSADATKRTTVCYSCGSPDHMSPDCPIRASTKLPGSHCPICNTPGHTARECPQQAADRQSTPYPRHDEDKYCRLYNRRGSCFRGQRCPYYHRCSQCNGGHPKRACPQQAR